MSRAQLRQARWAALSGRFECAGLQKLALWALRRSIRWQMRALRDGGQHNRDRVTS